MATDNPEVRELLRAIDHLLDALGRLELLAERLAARASLSPVEARDTRRELDTTRASIEQLDAMLTLRRQQMRPM